MIYAFICTLFVVLLFMLQNKIWIDNYEPNVTRNQIFLHMRPSLDKISRLFNRWGVYGALTILLIYNQK